MKKEILREKIEEIIENKTMSLEERINEVFELREEYGYYNNENIQENDIAVFKSLVDMLRKENNDHSQDLSLMQLLVLLAEAYVEMENFKAVHEVAYRALEILREDKTPVKVLELTVPRLIETVERTVYHHSLFEILVRFVRIVLRDNPDSSEVKEEAKKMLKLQLLLEDSESCAYLFDAGMKEALARMFSSEELTSIMLHPQLGHLKVDPVEYTWFWEEIYYDVENELDRIFANEKRHMGFCFKYWSRKRDLLKKKYGIEWRSPSQMNPRVMFD